MHPEVAMALRPFASHPSSLVHRHSHASPRSAPSLLRFQWWQGLLVVDHPDAERAAGARCHVLPIPQLGQSNNELVPARAGVGVLLILFLELHVLDLHLFVDAHGLVLWERVCVRTRMVG